MKKYFLTMLLMALIVAIISCGENGVEPQPQPGRRDYVWTVTEIKPGYESLYLTRIWGSSPNDVWSIGASSSVATSIWHYNGIRWKCDSLYIAVQPFAIYGFSESEIWLGNRNNTIWRYNGTSWVKYGEYSINGYNQTCINNFDAYTRSDIYCVGYVELLNANTWKAIIMHYDGTAWYFVDIPSLKVSFETVALSNDRVLVMSGTDYDPKGFIAKLYSWDGKELKELLSEQGWSFVTKLNNEIFATMNSKIYKYSNKGLTLWKDNTGTGINGNIICGRSKNDFFIGSTEGIKHFNGTDFLTVYPSSYQIGYGVLFEKEVFFNAYDESNGKNYIIHGQLK